MPITDMIPWKRQETARQEEEHALQTEESTWPAFEQEMNRLFERFFNRPGFEPFGYFHEAWGEFNPPVDAVETGKAIKLTVELPGLDDEEIDVSLTRELLTISGEKKQKRSEKEGKYILAERSYGAFKRSISLPCEVETGAVDAVFRNGVLTVTLTKAAKARARQRVAVKTKW